MFNKAVHSDYIYHKDESKCGSHCEDKCTMVHNKRKMIEKKVNTIANKLDDLLVITKPTTRDCVTEDEVTERFNYLRGELSRVERKVKKGKQPFTLTEVTK